MTSLSGVSSPTFAHGAADRVDRAAHDAAAVLLLGRGAARGRRRGGASGAGLARRSAAVRRRGLRRDGLGDPRCSGLGGGRVRLGEQGRERHRQPRRRRRLARVEHGGGARARGLTLVGERAGRGRRRERGVHRGGEPEDRARGEQRARRHRAAAQERLPRGQGGEDLADGGRLHHGQPGGAAALAAQERGDRDRDGPVVRHLGRGAQRRISSATVTTEPTPEPPRTLRAIGR